ncbi:thioester reductase domain-containing protein [Diaporthe amygdali]|uniref:thioester reductase domain-containing protein n=1 Tax=Phomopsis amygdali TaxID=1214568 RepID=UPI0022FE4B9D|nr:thioester reductase domain-containing protein [Diaporthe amygdali]KAJ0125235.1 thioester reductase domain-containing protein [Diaporthe amygdali]
MEPQPPTEVVSVDILIRRLVKTAPDKVMISYPDHELDFKDYTAADLDRLTKSAISTYPKSLRESAQNAKPGEAPAVAIVGASSLEYYVHLFALSRMGLTTVVMSPRLPDQGLAHLIRHQHCVAVFASGLSIPALERVKTIQENLPEFDIISMAQMAELDAISRHGALIDLPVVEYKDDLETPFFVIHSGGTTGLPKPVPRHMGRDLMHLAKLISESVPDILATLPVYHAFGFGHFIATLWGTFTLSLLNASRPVTASVILKALDITRCKALATVPHLLKFIVEAPGGAERLARLQRVAAAGSATPEVLGNQLAEKGVNIVSPYGQSESGALMRNVPGPDWVWHMPMPAAEPYLKFEPYGDEDQGLSHLVVLPGLPTLVMSNRPDGSYATQDLFVRHPTDPRKWKFASRADDIIVLVNGLKADPHLLEEAVAKNRNVDTTMAFGAGRDSLGLVVVPSAHASGLSKEELAASIAPDLKLGNSLVSAYTRVPLDAVIFREAGSEVPRTAKDTLIRSKFLEMCKEDIDAHYAAREAQSSTQVSIADDEVEDVVREVVSSVVSAEDADLGIDTDFFGLGMDSLQASYVRSRLLRRVNLGGRLLPTNVVFESPTVGQLTNYILAVRNGRDPKDATHSEREIAQGLLKKYTQFAQCEPQTLQAGPGRVVLITGATGFIGSHVIHRLASSSDVDQVYCLVRADSDEAADLRITKSLHEAHLEVTDSHQRSKIVALASDLGQTSLGLNNSHYEILRTSVTDIIHGAWAVNFNLSLSSFENPSIASISHLLNLAIRSPLNPRPKFSFISSIAAIALAKAQEGVKETRYGWEAASQIGYGQSKWVGEEICSAAVKYAAQNGVDLPVQILRVGQIVGDNKRGMWNPKEAIPLTVQSALTTGALPVVEGADMQYWLPVDIAAAAIIELAFRSRSNEDTEGARVFHVSNTTPLHWNTEFLPALARHNLAFEAIPQQEWLRRLESAVPNHRLLQHFKRRYGVVHDNQASTRAEDALDLFEARKYSNALRDGTKIDEHMIGRFLTYWLGLEEWKSLEQSTNTNGLAVGQQSGRRDSGVGICQVK